MSQEIVPYLPEEVILQILQRLPVKALVTFKSVSKFWLSLISTPQFINTHLNISRKSHKLLMLDHAQSVSNKCSLYSIDEYKNFSVDHLKYPVKAPGYIPQFIGSCNGLVCLFSAQNLLIVWNPSTRKYKEIPKEIPRMNQDYYYTHGFGYDEVNDDYKLVLVYTSKFKNSGNNEVMVYSLRANSWRKVKGFRSGYIYSNSGVFVNGIIHWDTRTHHDFDSCCYDYDIVLFNLATEEQGKLALPSYEQDVECFHSDIHWDLKSSSECLFGFCHFECLGYVDIWVMKEYGVEECNWTKFASVPYYIIPAIFDSPLFVNKDGEVLLINGQRLVLFNTRNNDYTDLQIHVPDAGTRLGIDLTAYNESLVSLCC